MDLIYLKKSLNKFPGDFNNATVFLVTKNDDGTKKYSLLAGVGQLIVGKECVALISEEICADIIADGKVKRLGDIPEDFEGLGQN